MTKFISLFGLLFILNLSQAQTAFDKFVGNDKMTAVVVNKKMFDLMSRVKMDESDKEAQKFMQMIRHLDALRVFVTSDQKLAADLKGAAEKHQKSLNLEELMSVNDGGKKVNILVRSGKNAGQLTELLMTVDGGKNAEMVVVSLTGLFQIEDLSMLSDRMDLPGKDHIKNAAKKKK